ncbi:hypothetical protein V565_272390 [Rhizoctonia solani 123E]|uniref:CCHC-type domain-containing protein n=1 Tax=Rhizoctonia solani 123E TaxID=1423351 RepID=A0A074RJ93_9AGAM|nr:hypothetical protein V565_272390 [Rhizoctonia solani 123E]
MSRKLRSGRNYDASKVPDAPKRQARKRKAPKETTPEEPPQAVENSGEQAIVPRQVQLTFGTTGAVASDPVKDVVIVGIGKRRGITLGDSAGVKLSPAAYMALTKRAPPVRRVMSWPLPTTETRTRADAPAEGEVTAQSSVKAADRAPGAQDNAPGNAECAPAAPRAPNTPRAIEPDSEHEVFVTTRTSRVLDESMALDESGNPLLAQYIVDDTSDSPTVSSVRKKRRHRKSKGKPKTVELEASISTESKSTGNHEGLTWDEEVRRATGNDAYAELYGDLPDVSEWANPDWSRSDYLSPSIPGSYKFNSETDRDSVQVNALIYEVDGDYVFDDDEYATVIRNLRESERSETPHSQTRGAEPSQSRRSHRVTVEEVDDESDKTTTSRTRSYVGKGKGKSKPKKKSKKRKRASLGMALEDLEGQRERPTRPREIAEPSISYRGGGYFENFVGSTPRFEGRAARNAQVTPSEEETRPRREATPPRDKPMRRGGPSTLPEPSDSSDDTHTSSSESDSNDSDSSDSSDTSSVEARTNSSRRSVDRRAEQRLERMINKLKKQKKKLERKVTTQARSGYKAQAPKPYKGEADIDKYDVFIFNYKLFVGDTKLSDSKAVLTMSRFLEEKAAAYFMLNVAPRPEEFTMQSVFVGLYEYCFPPDFKDEMRRKYNQKRQGESSVQDYFAELARLRMRLREIDDRQHVLRAWDGAAQYIKVGWALKGISAETANIETLREIALDIERAHKIKRSIEKSGNDKSNSRRDRSRSPQRKPDRRANYTSNGNNQNGKYRGGDNRNQPSGNGNGNRVDRRNNGKQNGGRDGGSDGRRKLSEEKKSELRAAGKCFECENTGHLSKDCPKFHRAKPAHIRANAVKVKPLDKIRVSSVMLKELDELTGLKERIEVSAVRVSTKGKEPVLKHVERNAEEAKEICKPANGDIPLPPFRAINHRIPLIDDKKIYKFRPSRCPEALKSQFETKAREYLGTGRWKHSTGSNAIPMLFIPKKKDGNVELRTVLDKHDSRELSSTNV